jgi:[CysO sulfur-carrier protein]-S-L-cysteine hydrolase
MIAHARDEAPNECCGMLGGVNGRVRTVHRARNAFQSPLRYDVDSRDLIRIYNTIQAQGDEIVGIYHSHTGTAAYPSQTDVNTASWPDALYIIVSLENPDQPVVRGFWLRDKRIDEEELIRI